MKETKQCTCTGSCKGAAGLGAGWRCAMDVIMLRGDDHSTSVWTDELSLLQQIAETSSDLVKGEGYAEFADAAGGMDALLDRHRAAVLQWQRWHEDGAG